MEFFFSEKGKRKLALEGYAYRCDKTVKDVTYWRCEKYLNNCPSRMSTTTKDEINKAPSNHSHPPDHTNVAVQKAKSKMRERAACSKEQTSHIIQSVTQEIPLENMDSLPQKTALMRMIQRKREEPEGDGLIDELRLTTRGEYFLLHEDDENGFYIFSSQRNLDLLSESPHWFTDGDFDGAPVGHQVYTVHALASHSRTVPLVYVISREKSEEVYNNVFRVLKEKKPEVEPESVTIDFEATAFNALIGNFPDAEILGSLFHLGRWCSRKVEDLALQSWYLENPEHELLIKCFQALAFVPPEDVVRRFDEIMVTLTDRNEQVLADFTDYFETTWIGPMDHQPRFEARCWNVFHRVKDDLPRTNNFVESWHNAFNKRVTISHPTFRKLVRKIRNEQSSNEVLIEELINGVEGPPKKKKIDAVNRRLKTIVEGYDANSDIMAYLQAVAHNL